ncbi:hypothetical protein B0H13DRAFT_1919472 [Mycena leptocephala]|nr:hypothetical protein B0H13DRAFT_1919472 [Mycena leptocephala]
MSNGLSKPHAGLASPADDENYSLAIHDTTWGPQMKNQVPPLSAFSDLKAPSADENPRVHAGPPPILSSFVAVTDITTPLGSLHSRLDRPDLIKCDELWRVRFRHFISIIRVTPCRIASELQKKLALPADWQAICFIDVEGPVQLPLDQQKCLDLKKGHDWAKFVLEAGKIHNQKDIWIYWREKGLDPQRMLLSDGAFRLVSFLGNATCIGWSASSFSARKPDPSATSSNCMAAIAAFMRAHFPPHSHKVPNRYAALGRNTCLKVPGVAAYPALDPDPVWLQKCRQDVAMLSHIYDCFWHVGEQGTFVGEEQ